MSLLSKNPHFRQSEGNWRSIRNRRKERRKEGRKRGNHARKKVSFFASFRIGLRIFFSEKSGRACHWQKWNRGTNLSHGSTCACGVKKKDFLHRRNFNEKTILFSIKVGNLHQLNHCGHFKPNYVVVGPRTMDTSKTP